MSWLMISVHYSRLPKTEEYRATFNIVRVWTEGEETMQELQEQRSLEQGSMGVLLEHLSVLLEIHPTAKVTMVQEPAQEATYKRQMKGYELDQQMVDLIRSNPERAKEMFQPILRTVSIRPPRIALQTEEN